eukprot:CAMPEP_0203673230 /NCGR_PEP_ID=MMETSP0090-20130426/11487_1 /ASSEMBLY_ACC=CAM_ASM_001088 /TAXON_ID=426623 /ORGANISM="Chaetoceros affinis, Strain CCMP159" /LENGTH=187 /DNA_ID=CAMNT_0050538821 /DNA_START=6 /DNA_END=569 /DNA_ORIENTATION=+
MKRHDCNNSDENEPSDKRQRQEEEQQQAFEEDVALISSLLRQQEEEHGQEEDRRLGPEIGTLSQNRSSNGSDAIVSTGEGRRTVNGRDGQSDRGGNHFNSVRQPLHHIIQEEENEDDDNPAPPQSLHVSIMSNGSHGELRQQGGFQDQEEGDVNAADWLHGPQQRRLPRVGSDFQVTALPMPQREKN